jgi:hypothetical protein
MFMQIVNMRRVLRQMAAVAAVLGAVCAVAVPAAQAQWWGPQPYDVGPWNQRWDRSWNPVVHGPWRPVLFRPRPAFVPPPPPPPVRTVVVRPPIAYHRVVVERTRPVFWQRTVVVHAPPVVIHTPPVVREKIVYEKVPVYVHVPVIHHHPVHHHPAIHYEYGHCGCN